jgi:hypothetical protein
MNDTARRRVWIAAAVFLAVLTVNLLGASYRAAEGDPVDEARSVLLDASAVRPSHLAQTTLFRGVWLLAGSLGFDGAPFIPLQSANAILGALVGLLILLVAWRLGVSTSWAVAAAVAWAVSFAPWLHSRTAETGVTPLPLVLGALLLAVRPGDANHPASVLGAAPRRADERWKVLLAATMLSAGIWLSLHLVLLVPAFLCLFSRRRALLAGAATLAVLSAAPFVAALVAEGVRTPAAAFAWLSQHPDTRLLEPSFSLMSIPRLLTGISRLVFPFAVGESAMKMRMIGHPVEIDLREWVAFARNVLAAAGLCLLFALGWWRIRGSALGWFAALAAVGVFAFNAYWLGSDPQFWLPLYPVILVVVAVLLDTVAPVRPWRRIAPVAAWLLIVMMFVTNRSFGPPCPVCPGGSSRWERARELSAQIAPNAVLLMPGPMVHAPFALVTSQRPDVRVVMLSTDPLFEGAGGAFLARLRASIAGEHARARAVYAYRADGPMDVASLGAWQGFENARAISRSELDAFLRDHFAVTPDRSGSGLVRLDARPRPAGRPAPG